MSLKLDDESLKTLQEGKGKNSVRSKSNSSPCQWDFFCFAALPFFSFKYSLATSFPEICLWRQSLWTPPFIVHRLWCVCVWGGANVNANYASSSWKNTSAAPVHRVQGANRPESSLWRSQDGWRDYRGGWYQFLFLRSSKNILMENKDEWETAKSCNAFTESD